jgi:mRNA-degrading endonuclease YafQ of YafQ-DinJ toxin-antitoxin module
LKKSLVIDPDVQKHRRALPKEQCADVVLKLLELGNAFGKPHEHSGLGIRKLRADLFECRIGLGLRLLFRVSPDALILRFIGSHDEVQKYLRTF